MPDHMSRSVSRFAAQRRTRQKHRADPTFAAIAERATYELRASEKEAPRRR
jgi:hypothetical protein